MAGKYEKVDDSGLVSIEEEDNRADPDAEYTKVPQWKTVFTLFVLFISTVISMNLPIEAKEGRAACVILATAMLWMTEAVPLMITALLPAIMFPMVGIMDTKEVSAKYFNYVSMLMMGTFLVAESVEACGLHKRIALKILSLLGRGEALLMLGASLCTWILSMFMSNTATTAMMLPIVGSILQSLREINHSLGEDLLTVHFDKESPGDKDHSTTVDIIRADGSRPDSKGFKWFCKGLLLCVPYGASIGGIATLTGTPPNLVLKSIFEATFPGQKSVDYQTWFTVAFPLSLILVFAGWTLLCLIYARSSYWYLITGKFIWDKSGKNKEVQKWSYVNKAIRKEYKKLGGLRFPEILLLLMLLLLIFLWLFRKLEGFDGWAEVHAKAIGNMKENGQYKIYLKDAWVVITLGLFLFIIPAENPFRGILKFKPPPGGKRFTRVKRLLDLETVMKKTPWDVLFILGGGYAIAAGCKDSGLSAWIGEQFSFLHNSPHVVIALVVSSFVAVLTEFASNTASTTLLLPVLVSLSQAITVHPLYLMMTGTLSASLAFCLPSATGPNALVFAYPEIKVIDMIRTGLVMNFVCVLLTVAATSTWVYTMLDLSEYPCWADPNDNITCTFTP
ncbi:Na(+)/citrate cotransporter-like [Bolinopsis microptera]|uniref:Na(+)/citrate cotransporter-like n=1 Tax=Bolinopsis microptera TaxID=2820187 RepID=UPI00307958E8